LPTEARIQSALAQFERAMVSTNSRWDEGYAQTFNPAQNNNGLDAGETTLFKSPSLKNVALSGAFMHDGRFSTLEQVVEHYNSGVREGPALDNRLRGGNNQPRVLNLPESDKAALVAFLRTLSDATLNADPKFSSPFKP